MHLIGLVLSVLMLVRSYKQGKHHTSQLMLFSTYFEYLMMYLMILSFLYDT